MNIIVTLAGHSRRFFQKGYNKPKFLIEISQKPMIKHVVNMFDIDKDNFFFVLNREQKEGYPEIIPIISNCVKNSKIIVIEPQEIGPIYTALQVTDINREEPLIVTYCDFFVQWNYKQFLDEVKNIDGAIPSFKGFHPASFGETYYAYTKIDNDNNLLELREKQSFTNNRSEEYANTGIYYFKKAELFTKYANKLLIKGFGNLSEGYISLLFNDMVKDNLKVKITEVEKFICWGTPDDLEEYYKWENIIKNSEILGYKSEYSEIEYKYWHEFFQKM